jgi:hypothetical protein
MKRHASRITKLREGSACTKYFHLKVNLGKQWNHISKIVTPHGYAISHEAKECAIFNHFSTFMGRPDAQALDFN